MMDVLNVYVHCKINEDGNVYFMRGRKFMNNPQDLTPSCSMFCYSYKAKRYVETYFYFISWDGRSRLTFTPDRTMFRMMLRTIGMDIR